MRTVALEKEQEEKKDAEAGVAAFRRQLASVREKCASLDAEIELHRRNVANLMRGTSPTRSSLKRSLEWLADRALGKACSVLCLARPSLSRPNPASTGTSSSSASRTSTRTTSRASSASSSTSLTAFTEVRSLSPLHFEREGRKACDIDERRRVHLI